MSTPIGRRRRNRHATVHTPVQLGLVIMPEASRLSDAIASLRTLPHVTLGPPQGHRIPATTVTMAGRDEALLDGLRALDGVLHVDAVFAHFLEEESS